MDDLERQLWEDSPLYLLMCAVVNGELSDWPTGYGEPSHADYMRDCIPAEREERGDGR